MCCVLKGLLKLSGSSGVPGHMKLKEPFRCCFQEQEKTPEVRGIGFKVTLPSLLLGTRVSSSPCRRAGQDPQSEMGAVRGCLSGAACRLEKEQCPTSRQGEGRRGEGSESCSTQKSADTRGTGGQSSL